MTPMSSPLPYLLWSLSINYNLSCNKICKTTKYHFRLFFMHCFLVWLAFFYWGGGCLVLVFLVFCFWGFFVVVVGVLVVVVGFLAQFYNIIASDNFSYSQDFECRKKIIQKQRIRRTKIPESSNLLQRSALPQGKSHRTKNRIAIEYQQSFQVLEPRVPYFGIRWSIDY